jgi:hypothetical protein
VAGSSAFWKAASRKTAVSRPSRKTDQRTDRAPAQRAGGTLAQLAAEARRVPAHPDQHEGDDPDGQRADDGLEHLLLALGQLLVDELQRDADAQADRDGRAHAGPHPAQRVRPALLAQEHRDDRDDERGLDPLAQADHERRKHALHLRDP